MPMMNVELVSTKSMTFAARLTDYLRKKWVIVLVIPAVIILVLVVLTSYASIIEWIFARPTKPPDFRKEDENLRNDEAAIDEEEKKKIDAVNAGVEKLKTKIEAGDISPAAVFDEELKKG